MPDVIHCPHAQWVESIGNLAGVKDELHACDFPQVCCAISLWQIYQWMSAIKEMKKSEEVALTRRASCVSNLILQAYKVL